MLSAATHLVAKLSYARNDAPIITFDSQLIVLEPYAAAAGNAEVQKAQRVALIDTLLKQYGQSREVGSVGSSPLLRRAARMFTGFTTRKNTTNETMKKLTNALMKAPI